MPPHQSTAESVLLYPLTALLLHSCHISLGFAGLAVVAACQHFVFDVHVKQLRFINVMCFFISSLAVVFLAISSCLMCLLHGN